MYSPHTADCVLSPKQLEILAYLQLPDVIVSLEKISFDVSTVGPHSYKMNSRAPFNNIFVIICAFSLIINVEAL